MQMLQHFAGFALLALLTNWALPATAAPQVGDPAPAFTLPGSDGEVHALADFRGHEAVVLAWFPRAFTSGCTIECKSLAENGHLLAPFAATYYMASVDPLEQNTAFAEDSGADFPLLSDADLSVAAAYGVLHEAGFAKRWTFYIDADGIIVAIDKSVRPATSAEDMAAKLEELGIPRRENIAYTWD